MQETRLMRILHVIPSVSASSGGPSKALAQMERALANRGIEMVTVTTDDDGDGRRLDVPLQTPVPSNGATRMYFRRQTNAYKVSLPLLAWLRRNIMQFDIVHVHALFSFAPVAAAWVARAAGVPYVIRPLGVLNRYGMVNRRSRMKAWSMAALENPLLRQAGRTHEDASRSTRDRTGRARNRRCFPEGLSGDRGAAVVVPVPRRPEEEYRSLAGSFGSQPQNHSRPVVDRMRRRDTCLSRRAESLGGTAWR